MMALVVSADARRTACRAYGLRSLCSAVEIGNVSSTDEDALWEEARKQRSGDGLRAYLSRYPTGAYAAEAHGRLAACVTVLVEASGPVDERRYARWRVNLSPTHSFPTQEQARIDARSRGNADAREMCASFGLTDRVLSGSVEPETWDCAEYEHGWMCGFTGDLVCRVQRLVRRWTIAVTTPTSEAAIHRRAGW